jgi:6,7-dimethyl-8-ribityllumazine synthase
MSSSGGFWPGEASAAEEEQGQEPDEQQADTEAAEPASEREPPATVAPATPAPEPQPEPEAEEEPEPELAPAGHLPGELVIPDGVAVLEGSPSGADRTVGVVVSRFNGAVTNQLLRRALEALTDAGVANDGITVLPVPGAFELPLAAMALAKTRRYACIVALGAIVRGETPHFDYVAAECASGLQLAGIETGVPVAFGVLTVDNVAQAEARIERAADAVRSALEMADLFARLRASSKA